jgi:hypothetical protein
LISAAGEAAGRTAGARADRTSKARNGMNHLQTRKGRKGIRQIPNHDVNAGGRIAAGAALNSGANVPLLTL